MCGAGLTGGVGAVELVSGSGRVGRLGRVERALGLLRWVGGLGRVCLGGGCVGGRVVLTWEFARIDIFTIRGGDLISQPSARPTAKPAYPGSFFIQMTIGSNNEE